MAQMKEQIKAPEKIQLSNKEIANLSDAQFKTPVVRKLTELVEFGRKLDEKMKAMLSEKKENVQGTNSDGKETGTQINGVDQKEETNIQPEKNEETRIRKNEERHRKMFLYPNPRVTSLSYPSLAGHQLHPPVESRPPWQTHFSLVPTFLRVDGLCGKQVFLVINY